MSKILRCRKCKQIFHFTVMGQLCPNCMALEEEVYQNVRSFIKENPGVSVFEISESLGVNASKILGYIKEERLEVMAGSSVMLKCKNCGADISTGMFCETCKRSMAVDTPRLTPKLATSKFATGSAEQGRAVTASSMKDYRNEE